MSFLIQAYRWGWTTKDALKAAVASTPQKLTAEQYQQITGETYSA